MYKRGIIRAKSLINPGQGKSLIDVINFLGLRSNLITCIDAGDRRSYTGDRRLVYDLSGNNNHWRFGTGTSTGAASNTGGTNHPLFYGRIGGLSGNEYFSGAVATNTLRRFTPYLGTETYDDNWHKEGGTVSAVFVYFQNSTAVINLFSNQAGATGGSTVNGVGFTVGSTGTLSFAYDVNTGAADASSVNLSTGGRVNNIGFAGVSFNENGNVILRNNSATSTTAATNSINVTNPGNVLTVGAEGDGGTALVDRKRLYCWAFWSSALTSQNLLDIYTQLKETRYLGLFG